MKTSMALKTLLGTASLALPLMAFAESSVVTGGGALSTTAHVDFSIVIPKILYLRVGTGTTYNTGVLSPANATIDVVTFSPTVANLGSAPIGGTGGDPAAGPGAEMAAIVSNTAGVITLSAAANAAGLSDGAGDNIAFTQITTAATAGSFATLLNPPALTNGTTTTTITPAGKVFQGDAKWTYTYTNNTVPPAGTYGAIVANNSRVTYTASVP